MVAINFNAYAHEPSNFEAIPAAWYMVRINDTQQKPTRNNGSYLEIEYVIVDGQYANRKLFDRLNLQNDSEKAVSIAQQTLTTILFCLGMPQIADTAQMHGAVLQARVIIEKTESFGDQNRIKGYQDIHGRTATEIKKAMSEGAGTAPPQAPPPSGAPPLVRPTDPNYIHNAGQPDESWWNGTAWIPAPVQAAPPAPPPPPQQAAPPPQTTAYAPPPPQQAGAPPINPAYSNGSGAGQPPISPTQQATQGATPPWS